MSRTTQFITVSIVALLIDHCSCQNGPVYSLCNPFSGNASFVHNLGAVVANLTQEASKSLYASATSEAGLFNESYAYGFYQCRGDSALSDCSACVSNALVGDPECHLGVGARVQYEGCYIRYEAFDFFGEPPDDASPLKSLCSGSGLHSSHSQLYRQHLGTALRNSSVAALKHPVFGFDASSVGSDSSAAYVLLQCMGVVSPSRCASCLAQVTNYSSVCNDSLSGEIYYNGCYYIFGPTDFFTAAASLPAFSPSPQPTSNSTIPQGPAGKYKLSVQTIVGIVMGISLAIAVVAIVAFCFTHNKWRKKDPNPYGSLFSLVNKRPTGLSGLPSPGAVRFSLEELREATRGFNIGNKLGQGGFGPVYQGTLKSGKEVAIKMLSADSHQGEMEFMNEVRLLTIVQHRNLVKLIGGCIEESKRFLVYEYFQNRSLNLHLFGFVEDDALDWSTRFDILMGIARGLRYLHEDSNARIVHRDIKTSNVLLDDNFNPKIADFGLARFFSDDITHLSTRIAGTLGYVAPEYARNGRVTEKADVYSFGIVALEIVSGRKMIDNREEQNLLEWTWALYERQEQVQIMDQRMHRKGAVNMEQVSQVVQVALLCSQSRAQARPTMAQVQTILHSRSDLLELLSKPITIDAGSSSQGVAASNGDSSISYLEPR